EAQNAQMVLGDSLERVADEADVAMLEVVQSAEIIIDFTGPGVGGQRIDGEVAPGRILLPVVGVSDCRAPSIGRNVPAQRCDFERVTVADGRNRTVVDSRRNRLDLRGL